MPRSTPAEALLREYVAIPSVHPEADSGGTPKGEDAAAGWLADRLAGLGADVRWQSWPDAGARTRRNLIATFEPAGRATATVVFAPHTDTVGVSGMTVPPFRLTARKSRLHGRGACDTKGPAVALLAALASWVKSPARRSTSIRWVVAATAGEEQGSLGAQALVRSGFRADFAIALEPTGLRVVHAAKGILRAWVEVPGKAAHGATPHRGRNAILEALPVIDALYAEVVPALSRRPHPVLGAGSLNLGIVRGGGELNLVPSRCDLGLDIRWHPDFPSDRIWALLQKTVRTAAPRARLRLHRKAPPFVTGRDQPWARRLRACGRGWASAPWFCDANVFGAAGIPSVAFGPGDIAQAHTANESIERAQLEAGVAAFGALLATPST